MTGLDIYEAMNGIDDKYLEESLQAEDVIDIEKHRGNLRKHKSERHKLKNRQRWAVSVAATIVLAFVGVVNLFPSVAYAMSDMVLLGDLAKAVTFDPSMRACLENEYAQYVGEEYVTPEGYHSKVYYMVVDPSRISIFYKSGAPDNYDEEDIEKVVEHMPEVHSADGREISWTCTFLETDIKGLYEARIDIYEGQEVPDKFNFELDYCRYGEEEKRVDPFDGNEVYTRASYDFSKAVYTLYPDSKYTTIVDHYEINKDVEIEGQHITVKAVDVYPTQARLYLSCDEDNDKLLTGFEAVLIDDQGREYINKSNGLTSSYDDNGNQAVNYYESSYFVETKSLKIAIREVSLLDKDRQWGDISYENRTIDNMPEGISIDEMKLNDEGGLILKLNISKKYKICYGKTIYYQPCQPYNKETGENAESDGAFNVYGEDDEYGRVATEYCLIDDFEENKYEMEWYVGNWIKLEEPVEISVK